MEKHLLGAVLALFLFTGCQASHPALGVLRGNREFSQGHYQKAIILYMDALKTGQYEPWIQYNLGNVYTALGEGDAAMEMWKRAGETENKDLLFRLSFNRGHLYYLQGEYREAFRAFQEALRYNPASHEAKINLELTLVKLKAGGSSGASDSSVSYENNQDLNKNHRRILEYVKRKEGRQWQTPEEAPSSSEEDW